jgi:cytochrome c oxidase subunit 2
MRPRCAFRPSLIWSTGLLLTGCSGPQSSLDPYGPDADTLARLFWNFTGFLTLVWVVTMFALLFALRPRPEPARDPLAHEQNAEHGMVLTVAIATALTVISIAALTVVSYGAQRVLFSDRSPSLSIEVTGHQWWWEVRYEDPRPSQTFATANEIHIPVATPVILKLAASDVIHSFWVPRLAGKLDLIPGRTNELRIQADKPGIYRGQCAEFCGWQHAHMAMLVVAHTQEDFQAWRAAQVSPARPPADAEQKRGQEIFLKSPCVMCHQIRGTPAAGKVAPDLTHVGSRRTIAAATLPNTRGNLAAWIVDPQGIKPGVHMPLIKLDAGEIQPLAAYLEGLK